MSEPHILLTGFQPFGGDTVNPSGDIAKAMDGRRFGPFAVRASVLPVEHVAARRAVAAALDEAGLGAVVHLGLAGGRARVALEQIGVNAMEYPLPDAAGRIVTGEPCASGGPAAYLATLPTRAILAALTDEGVPAYLSYTAGTYLCNYVLYSTLHALAPRDTPPPAGFIHLPFLPGMVAAHRRDEPSMEMGLMLRAAEIALAVVAASA